MECSVILFLLDIEYPFYMKTRESGMPDEEAWNSFFDPKSILEKLGLRSNENCVVEFGSGYGTFALEAAPLQTNAANG